MSSNEENLSTGDNAADAGGPQKIDEEIAQDCQERQRREEELAVEREQREEQRRQQQEEL